MTTPAQWLAGARPRTLPAAVAPVAVGTAAAAAALPGPWLRGVSPVAALLALTVALALQVAVNYANDYSDGIRGTDADRVGPFRLVGSGAAAPRAVLRAALLAFGVAAIAGLVLVLVTGTPELLAAGALCLLAGWYYTGGRRPYGYRGLGEVSVFVFFGLVAVTGTAYVQLGRMPAAAALGGVACGALACALLVVNNLRDIPGDEVAGKRTLAVRLGAPRTRGMYVALLALAYVVAAVLTFVTPWTLLALGSAPLALPPSRRVLAGAGGRALVPVLAATGRVQLAYALLLSLGLLLT
jgi:1,4-dihydroxy-2-naphthoate octaprenyltransferase